MYVRSLGQRKIDVCDVFRAKKNWCTDSVNVKYFSNEHALGQLTQYLDNNWTSNWTICARARSDLSINVQVFSAHSFWRNCYKCFCSAEANKGFLLTCNGVDHKCFCGPLQAIVVQVFLYRQGQTSTLADRCEDVKRTGNLTNVRIH